MVARAGRSLVEVVEVGDVVRVLVDRREVVGGGMAEMGEVALILEVLLLLRTACLLSLALCHRVTTSKSI